MIEIVNIIYSSNGKRLTRTPVRNSGTRCKIQVFKLSDFNLKSPQHKKADKELYEAMLKNLC
jgi:hypothetical protein